MKSTLIRAAAAAALLLGAASTAHAYTLFDDAQSGIIPTATDVRRLTPANSFTYQIGSAVPTGVTFAQWETVVDDAMATYSAIPNSNLNYVDGGSTATGGNSADGNSVIEWDLTAPFDNNGTSVGSGVLGFSSIRQAFGDGRITENDIRMNGIDHTWSTTNIANTFDVAAVLVHEAGHMSGLQHGPIRATTMYPSAAAVGQGGQSGTNAATLSLDDTLGVQAIYGSDGSTLGSITGTIDSSSGDEGIFVGVVSADTGDTTGAITGMRNGQANEDYAVERLEPGDYYVFILPLDDDFGMVPSNASNLITPDTTFSPRFYSSSDPTGTPLPGSASLVTVTAGSTTSGISIDPPDVVVSENVEATGQDVQGTSAWGPGGAEIFSASQGLDLIHASAAALSLTPQVLGGGGTFSTSTPFGNFGPNVLKPSLTNFVYRHTLTTTSANAGVLKSIVIPISGTEVDILPGALDYQVTVGNSPPSINITASESVTAGTINGGGLTLGTASDPDQIPNLLNLTLSNVPAGVTFNGATILSTGDVFVSSIEASCAAVPGNYNVTFTVEDSATVQASDTLPLTIVANSPPVLGTYPATESGDRGTNIVIDATTGGSDPDNNISSGTPFSVSPTTAPGGGAITIDQITGDVTVATTGSTAIGSFNVTVTLTDDCGDIDQAVISVEVIDPFANVGDWFILD